MKKPIFVKILSALLNIFTYLCITIIILILHNWYQSGDTYSLIIWMIPLAVVIAAAGGTILYYIRTSNNVLRMLVIFIIAFLFSLAWFYIILYIWSGNRLENPFSVTMFYLWIAGNFTQLLFLDRRLPKQKEKPEWIKILFGIILVPMVLIVLYFFILFADNFYSSSHANKGIATVLATDTETESLSKVSDISEYLLKAYDSSDATGYTDPAGYTVIPFGKYHMCFTDTFRTYAIVVKDSKIVAIDQKENVLYQVYDFDNGPDYASDHLFRIVVNHKMGFADVVSGKIIISPQFDCAFPFEDGIAKVSKDCKTVNDGHEHPPYWTSDHWFYIDTKGNMVSQPKTKANKKMRSYPYEN